MVLVRTQIIGKGKHRYAPNSCHAIKKTINIYIFTIMFSVPNL